eukprot:TRINITY_DN82220_c0_g1_i1.p1 TRINITY_DN82220_c0_g1~~TRINITY_DN82220_c0_g1_i1.p1  ORF type:complete len:231 (+),score=44.66 TRINITY_DN82220_c0_g1_i1:145-837(+)
MSRHDIEITEGIQERTSRLNLKKKMQQFGEVDACHMGNRGSEMPLVRYKTLVAAENALNALKTGQVYLDGFKLDGEWRGTTHVKRTADPSRDNSMRDSNQDLTSRDFFHGRMPRRSPRRDRSPRERRPSPRRPVSPRRPPVEPVMKAIGDAGGPSNFSGGFSGGFTGGFSGGGPGGKSRSRSRRRRSRSRIAHLGQIAKATILRGSAFEENVAAGAALTDNPLFKAAAVA